MAENSHADRMEKLREERRMGWQKDDPDMANKAQAMLTNEEENMKQDIPTSIERLGAITGTMEVITTDGDVSQLTSDDIGNIYSWLLWAQANAEELSHD